MTRNALARTYRPRRFGEMITQEHVSETLRSAIARDRVAHAYLFSGPRGVGKTTAARVLAMALNCPNRGEDGEPCGECESCERIWSGKTSLDVVEIDAASNRGVDDARELRERAMYAPTEEGRFKVYIIDEAHMLTREAWNALLKILEEPPPRVIFVFATTEPQKIQQTASPILSRTQRFDFRRLGVPAIVERLAQVLSAEGVETDRQALLLLARRAEGGMRDALSLLDQALSFVEGHLTAEDVQRILGLVADEVYLDLFGIIAEGRVADVFRFVQDIVEGGYDLSEFYRGLADALRTLLVVRFDGAEAAQVRDDLRPLWSERAEAFSTGDLLRMLAQVAELDADGRFRKSSNPRVLLEALLLRFAHLPRTVEIEQLIRATGGAPAPTPDAVPAMTPVARPAPPTRGPRTPPPGGTGGEGDTGDTGDTGADASDTVDAPGPTNDPGDTAPSSRAPDAPVATGGSTPPPEAGSDWAASAGRREADAPPGAAGDDPSPHGPGTPVATAAPPAAAAVSPERALRAIAAERDAGLPSGLGMFLRSARVTEPSPGRVVVEFRGSPGMEILEREPRAVRTPSEALAQRLGRPVEVDVRAAEAGREPARLTPERLREEELRKLSGEEPALDRAVKEWDLEMLD